MRELAIQGARRWEPSEDELPLRAIDRMADYVQLHGRRGINPRELRSIIRRHGGKRPPPGPEVTARLLTLSARRMEQRRKEGEEPLVPTVENRGDAARRRRLRKAEREVGIR